MSDKPTIASDWLAGCAGCHMSLLDIDERLLTVVQKATLTATPITDLKQPAASGVTVGILEGAVANSANEEVAHRMRARSKILVAMGDCACFGGVPALRNCVKLKDALNRAYVETESTVDGKIPSDPELATMQPVRALGDVVKVDVFLPGCPPPPDAIFHCIAMLADGHIPTFEGLNLDWH
jgi:NAD-reducing hydrogenase small subunit